MKAVAVSSEPFLASSARTQFLFKLWVSLALKRALATIQESRSNNHCELWPLCISTPFWEMQNTCYIIGFYQGYKRKRDWKRLPTPVALCVMISRSRIFSFTPVVFRLFLALLSTSNHSGAGRYSREASLYHWQALSPLSLLRFQFLLSLAWITLMSTFLFPCCEVKTAKDISWLGYYVSKCYIEWLHAMVKQALLFINVCSIVLQTALV